MEEKKIIIYGLVDPKNKEIIKYVGKTSSKPNQRLSQHIFQARKGCKRYVYNWIRQILKNGEIPKIITLENVTESNWEEKEIFWISELRKKFKLTNLTDGGETTIGYRHTDETK